MIKAVRVSVLILLLACSAQAGYIPNGVSGPAPTPTPAPAVEEPAAEGEATGDLAEALTEAALSVLNNVLALL